MQSCQIYPIHPSPCGKQLWTDGYIKIIIITYIIIILINIIAILISITKFFLFFITTMPSGGI